MKWIKVLIIIAIGIMFIISPFYVLNADYLNDTAIPLYWWRNPNRWREVIAETKNNLIIGIMFLSWGLLEIPIKRRKK
jgi:hypothetical protein